jgi:hypothetical protein
MLRRGKPQWSIIFKSGILSADQLDQARRIIFWIAADSSELRQICVVDLGNPRRGTL